MIVLQEQEIKIVLVYKMRSTHQAEHVAQMACARNYAEFWRKNFPESYTLED
jgi:hypothetical protein